MFPNMHSPDAEYHMSYNQLLKGFLCFYLKYISHQQLQMRIFVFKIQYIDNIPSSRAAKKWSIYFNRESRKAVTEKFLFYFFTVELNFIFNNQKSLGYCSPPSPFKNILVEPIEWWEMGSVSH